MTLETLGAMLAVLVVIFVIGHAWFHLVEGVLGGLRRLFGKKEPAAWHPLRSEQEKKNHEDES